MDETYEGPTIRENLKVAENEFVNMARKLGFVETEEMTGLREQIVECLKNRDKDKARDIFLKYDSMGELFIKTTFIDNTEGQSKAKLGLMILKAIMYYLAGDMGNFTGEWNHVELVAKQDTMNVKWYEYIR